MNARSVCAIALVLFVGVLWLHWLWCRMMRSRRLDRMLAEGGKEDVIQYVAENEGDAVTYPHHHHHGSPLEYYAAAAAVDMSQVGAAVKTAAASARTPVNTSQVNATLAKKAPEATSKEWKNLGCFVTGRLTERSMTLVPGKKNFKECLAEATKQKASHFGLRGPGRCMLFNESDRRWDRDGKVPPGREHLCSVREPIQKDGGWVYIGGPSHHSVYQVGGAK